MSDSENESTEEELKIVLLGDCSVGKTSLVKRFCINEFSRQYYPTSGVDFFLKRMVIQRTRNTVLKIWDVQGRSHSGNMLDKYVFGSNVGCTQGAENFKDKDFLIKNWQILIFVYDITNETSFYNIEIWLEIIKSIIKHQDKKPLLALLGNKCDLEHQRMIKLEKHQKFASRLNLFSYIVSARTGESVNVSFQKIIAEYLGVRLTKLETEEHQPVVKAEISTYSSLPPQPVRNLNSSSKSSVCSMQ